MASSIDASTSGAGGVITTADNTGILQLKTAGTTAVTVDASQNVGIGTTTMTGKFNVSAGRSFFAGNSEQYSIGVGYNQSRVSSGAQVYYIGATDSATPALVFSEAGGAERMRIDSSGVVLLGRTSSGYLANQAGVVLNDSSQGTCYFASTGTAARSILAFINGIGGTPAQAGSVVTNGSSTSYATSSDYRLKENIVPMTGALDKVLQLKPVTYTWKADGSNAQGFIAHELQEVVPDAVTGEKDAVETYKDEDGNEQTRIKPQGIDTSFLVATLTSAIQEQQTIINDLKARITALEGAK